MILLIIVEIMTYLVQRLNERIDIISPNTIHIIQIRHPLGTLKKIYFLQCINFSTQIKSLDMQIYILKLLYSLTANKWKTLNKRF